MLLAVQCPIVHCRRVQSLSRGYDIHTIVPHCSYTLHYAVQSPAKNLLLSIEGSPPTPLKSNSSAHPSDPTHHPKRQNWRIYRNTELLLLLLCTINWPKLTVCHCRTVQSSTRHFLSIKFHLRPASRYCVFFAMLNANYYCISRIFLPIILVCILIASEKINSVHLVCCCNAVSRCNQ